MARGPVPASDEVNALKGDPGKRRRHQVTVVAPPGVPVMPDGLDEVSQSMWNSLVPELVEMGALSFVDAPMLTTCCQAWSRYVDAANYVIEYGFAGEHYAAAAKAIKENWAIFSKCLIEFGCTPAARTRVRVAPKKEVKDSKWRGILPDEVLDRRRDR